MGEDPLQVQLVWHKLYKALGRLGTQWGARGLIIQAISGIEIALWDILASIMANRSISCSAELCRSA